MTRAKKVKRLRRIARSMSGVMPEVKYMEQALNPKKPTKRTRFLYECGRLIYKNLKKRHL